MPRPMLPGFGTPAGTEIMVRYGEGAEVGYRWFAKTAQWEPAPDFYASF